MMTSTEFREYLEELGLRQAEAATLLSVSQRTLSRWLEMPSEIPGPTEQAVRAWMRLQRSGLPWHPDGVAIGEDDPEMIAEQIGCYRKSAIELDALLERVRERGGPAAPWSVDLGKRHATLGPVQVSFYPLVNGGFSPAFYTRSDIDPDLERDWPLLEDAFACIANAIAEKGPDWAKRSSNLRRQR